MATINGSSGDDIIVGTLGDDEIKAKAGNDIIDAGEGNDIIDAGDGDNEIHAGQGNDTINAGAGDDTTPKPADVLSRDSLAAIAAIGKTPDEYYQNRGYKGGWKEFWEKRGKEYFGEPTVA